MKGEQGIKSTSAYQMAALINHSEAVMWVSQVEAKISKQSGQKNYI